MDSPLLTFEYSRLSRQVQLRQEVYQTLTKAHEEARIAEVRDTPVLTVIDSALAPVRPSGPHRIMAEYCLVALIFGGALGVSLAYVAAARARHRGRSPLRTIWLSGKRGGGSRSLSSELRGISVIGFVAALAALLYCFVWLRPPELGGVALPLQRVLGWTALALLLVRLLIKGPLIARAAARSYLWWVAAFVAFLLLCLFGSSPMGENLFPLYFVMDLSKYAGPSPWRISAITPWLRAWSRRAG